MTSFRRIGACRVGVGGAAGVNGRVQTENISKRAYQTCPMKAPRLPPLTDTLCVHVRSRGSMQNGARPSD